MEERSDQAAAAAHAEAAMHDLRGIEERTDTGRAGQIFAAIIVVVLLGLTAAYVCEEDLLKGPAKQLVPDSDLPSIGPPETSHRV